MPVKVQCGGSTPYCSGPSSDTGPDSAVTAVGMPTVTRPAVVRTTMPPDSTGRGNDTESDRPTPVPVTTASCLGSQRSTPDGVTRPTCTSAASPRSTGTAHRLRVRAPPKY